MFSPSAAAACLGGLARPLGMPVTLLAAVLVVKFVTSAYETRLAEEFSSRVHANNAELSAEINSKLRGAEQRMRLERRVSEQQVAARLCSLRQPGMRHALIV